MHKIFFGGVELEGMIPGYISIIKFVCICWIFLIWKLKREEIILKEYWQ